MKARALAVPACASLAQLAFGIAAATSLAACGPAPSQDAAMDALSYSVAPELAPAFESAAARLRGASGVQLVAEGGTSVDAVSELSIPSPDGEPKCGVTVTRVDGSPLRAVSVRVELLWPTPDGCDVVNSLTHELVHSLRRSLYISREPLPHAADGVFAFDHGNGLLTDASLSAICEAVDCSTFAPEAP